MLERALPLALAAASGALFVACGSVPAEPSRAGQPNSASLVNDHLDTRGIVSDGTDVEVWVSVSWLRGGPPPGRFELTMEEVPWPAAAAPDPAPAPSGRRCVATFPIAPEDYSVRSEPGDFQHGIVHARGRFDPPCAPAAPGMRFHQSLAWIVGEGRIQVEGFQIPTGMGGDGFVHSHAEEDEVFARLAYEGRRPTPEQDELPALEAMLDELAAASGAVPEEALASDVRCPHDVPPATIVVPLQALRTLAASADGTLAARIDLAGPLPIPPEIGTLATYAGGGAIGYAAPEWPPPEVASFRVVRVTEHRAPVMGDVPAEGAEAPGWFVGGAVSGIVYIVDRRTDEAVCRATFSATNRDAIRGSRQRSIMLPEEDLRDETTRAIVSSLERIGARAVRDQRSPE